VLNTIKQSWGWTGLDPAAITAVNEFGDLIVRATDNAYWRICPEQLSCKIVARTTDDFNTLWTDDAFQLDWQMARLVTIAEGKFGAVSEDRCYCLKLPAALGGLYDSENLGTISRVELIAFAGDLAQQIKHTPDGAMVKLTLTNWARE